MCTARGNLKSISMQRIKYKDYLYKISVDLDNILELNEQKKTVLVEPSVTIGTLNDFLISKGWTLPVVPELDDLTIGGLVMGEGIETTSQKYGLFKWSCRWVKIISK